MKTYVVLQIGAAFALGGMTSLHGQSAPATQPGVTASDATTATSDEPATTPNAYNTYRPGQLNPFSYSAPIWGRRAATYRGKVLVIRSADGDAQSQTNLEEDLAVMSHIFDNVLADRWDSSQANATAMGIDVAFPDESDGFRTLYIAGYGALFMLRVDFALLPPPKASGNTTAKEPADSAWEQAKRELYGRPAGEDIPNGGGEQYNEERVNRLRGTLLGTLKSASNIRDLEPSDFITVCVFGNGGNFTVRNPAANDLGNFSQARGYNQAFGELFGGGIGSANGGLQQVYHRGTRLTIRAKKSDIDSFASGKISLSEFTAKVSIVTSASGLSGDRMERRALRGN